MDFEMISLILIVVFGIVLVRKLIKIGKKLVGFVLSLIALASFVLRVYLML